MERPRAPPSRIVARSENAQLFRRRSAITPVKSGSHQLDEKRPLLTFTRPTVADPASNGVAFTQAADYTTSAR
jgi:hypothetical protein